jgi:hypothetical protein
LLKKKRRKTSSKSDEKQGQRKAWHIPSPKNLTFDLENQ